MRLYQVRFCQVDQNPSQTSVNPAAQEKTELCRPDPGHFAPVCRMCNRQTTPARLTAEDLEYVLDVHAPAAADFSADADAECHLHLDVGNVVIFVISVSDDIADITFADDVQGWTG